MTTSIEWTDATWNPVRGCSVLSAGCTNCYAMRQAHRFSGPGGPYEGLTRERKRLGPVWTGEVRFVPEKLAEPLSWRKPRRVFVNSMSDLFHEGVSNEQIAAIFGVMAAAPQHTFQVLTKRPERAREWFAWVERQTDRGPHHGRLHSLAAPIHYAQEMCAHPALREIDTILAAGWPLLNVDVGVSVEDQTTADARIPHLLAMRQHVGGALWVSQEPQIGPVSVARWLAQAGSSTACSHCGAWASAWCAPACPMRARREVEHLGGLSWIVIGGESGPGARPFDLAWARSTIAQCREAEVPVFFKQAGTGRALHTDLGRGLHVRDSDLDRYFVLRDRKGGDMSEWPSDLRVREWPEARGG